MTLTVHWFELNHKSAKTIKLSTVAGVLRIYHWENVVTKTQWCFEKVADSDTKNSLAEEIQAYLNNTRNLTVILQKQGTSYRHKVWNEICNIPAGQVISYSTLAKKIGSGARAVANACKDNPFPGIIPCHRVVSVSGLGGYMGQTHGKFLDIKKSLLAHESSQCF